MTHLALRLAKSMIYSPINLSPYLYPMNIITMLRLETHEYKLEYKYIANDSWKSLL